MMADPRATFTTLTLGYFAVRSRSNEASYRMGLWT